MLQTVFKVLEKSISKIKKYLNYDDNNINEYTDDINQNILATHSQICKKELLKTLHHEDNFQSCYY